MRDIVLKAGRFEEGGDVLVPGFRKPATLLRKSSHLRAGLRCSKDFDVTQWAGVVYRYYVCFPSMRGGFDSSRPHHPQKIK